MISGCALPWRKVFQVLPINTPFFPTLLNDAGLKRLAALFPDALHSLRLVGGAVRDALLGKISVDFDLSTLYTPEEVLSFLKKGDVTYGTMGLRFGTISAFLEGKTYDITTCRRDIKTDGRWAEVQYTAKWEEDALRRDFTFNALYLTLDGELVDYHGGLSDLTEGRVRFIGDPQARLTEDRLRLLRYYRFWASYGKGLPDPELIPLFKKTAQQLDILSPDRIRHELLKILEAPHTKWAVLLPHMTDTGLWQGLFKIDTIDTANKNLSLKPLSPLGRLWALFPRNFLLCAQRLNLSRQEQKYLVALNQAYHQEKALPFSILDQYGEAVLKDWALLHNHSLQSLVSPIPIFPLKAEDLMDLGFKGPALGRALSLVRLWWRDQNGHPSKEECLRYAIARIRS